jgi:hypothetical protein
VYEEQCRKSSLFIFNNSSTSSQSDYTLSGLLLEIGSDTKYLGAKLQLDLKFEKHLEAKIYKQSQLPTGHD